MALGDSDVALALALEAMNLDSPPPEAQEVLRQVAQAPGTHLVIDGHDTPIQFVTFSPDGHYGLSMTNDEIILWNLATGDAQRYFATDGSSSLFVSFSPEGQYLLSASRQSDEVGVNLSLSTVTLWNIASGEVVRQIDIENVIVNALIFLLYGNTFLVAGESTGGEGYLASYDVETGEILNRYAGHESTVNGVVLMPEEKYILSYGDDHQIIQWDWQTGDEIRRYILDNQAQVKFVSWHPRNQYLLVGTRDLQMRLLDVETGEEVQNQTFSVGVDQGQFLSNGEQIIFWQAGQLVIWDIAQWETVTRFGTDRFVFDREIRHFAYHPERQTVLTGDTQGELRLWKLGEAVATRRFVTDGTPLISVSINPDGTQLATGSLHGDLMLWDIATGEIAGQYASSAQGFSNSGRFSPDGRFIVHHIADLFGPTEETALLLRNVATGEIIQSFEGHSTYIRAEAFSPDGQFILSGSQNLVQTSDDLYAELILWDASTGQIIRRFNTNQDTSWVEFSSDGQYAFTTSSYNPGAYQWDVESGELIRHFKAHTREVYSLSLSFDDQLMVTSSEDGSIIVWQIATGKIRQRLFGHEAGVWAIEMSADNQFLLSASSDGEVILWDVQNGFVLQRLDAHTQTVFGVAFSPDSSLAYTAGLDGQLIEWQIDILTIEELLTSLQQDRYVRSLTSDELARYGVEQLIDE